MKKRWMMIAVLLLAALGLAAGMAEDTTNPEAYQTGNTVFFGTYEQDGDPDNGPEPIEWTVLDVQDGEALLHSRYILDAKPFNSKKESNLWAESTLRTWLNKDFLNTAFNAEEQAAILMTVVDNSASQGYRTTLDENSTRDQVFLLSYHEAFSQYYTTKESRARTLTEYAHANGHIWWLRSPYTDNSEIAALVLGNGGSHNNYVTVGSVGVCPAIWINLSAFCWTCPDCGRENDGAFCPWCGAKKPEPAAAAAVVCPGCGAEYEADTEYVFCKKCGTKLPKNEEEAPVDPAQAIRGTWSLKNVTGSNQDIVDSLKGQMRAGYEQRMTFTGKTVTIYARLEYQETTVKGVYTLNGDSMTMTMEGADSQTVGYSVYGDTLKLDYGEYTLVFTR